MKAARQEPRVLASIHDVAPPHALAVQRLWSACRDAGFIPALFVVPNWHGQWPLAQADAFVEWIRERAADGAEVFLHGERHDEVGSPRGLRDHFRAVGRTAAEGEFLTLDRWSARTRIRRGVLYLWALGLRPVGFVPPAWLAHEGTHEVVRETGLAFSEDAGHVYVHDGDRSVALAAPAVRWSGRTTVRAHLSRVAVGWHWLNASRTPLVRLALHPQDLSHPITARSALTSIARWGEAGAPSQYAEVRA
ncbi:MAG: DUF2334 domain-containing protein [Gemmatimonadaceae bacterium]|nr:DUF2334 domain-containing protein [Gemmatimonadaceae bacterium]